MMNHLEVIEWANGKVFSPPRIDSSWNGWWYRPDEARTPKDIQSGKKSTFGRGHEGAKAAKAWLTDFCQRKLDSFNWELPSKISNPRDTQNGRGFSATTIHPIWGNVTYNAHVLSRAYGSNPTTSYCTYTVTCHPLAKTFFNQYVTEELYDWHDEQITYVGKEGEAVQDFTAFAHDPIKACNKRIESPLLTFLQTDDDVVDLPWETALANPKFRNKVYFYGDQKNMYFIEGYAHEAVIDNYDGFMKVIRGLKSLGVDISTTTRDFGESKYLLGLNFNVPANPAKGQQHEHTIDINLEQGINVECGYVADEQRWIDYQQRNAANYLQELAEEIGEPKEEVKEYRIPYPQGE
jgi:hypothetical protein